MAQPLAAQDAPHGRASAQKAEADRSGVTDAQNAASNTRIESAADVVPPSSSPGAPRVAAQVGVGLLASVAGVVGGFAVGNAHPYNPYALLAFYGFPAIGSTAGVYLVGKAFRGQGAAWATGLGATLGTGAALAGSIIYVSESGDSGVVLASMAVAGPLIGAIAGYELSHNASRKQRPGPTLTPTASVDSSGDVRPALSLSMRF